MKLSKNLILLNNNKYNNYYLDTYFGILSHKYVINSGLIIENLNYLSNANYYYFFTSFLFKKEKIYTKLKYSRVPMVDIVSGGIASLLAGLLGFLVTEKAGFELLDSGDFFVVAIYTIIIVFIFRVLYINFNYINKINLNIFLSFSGFVKYFNILIKLIYKRK